MLALPVLGDIDATGDPYLVVGLDVIEEAFQRREASRSSGDPTVQPDGEHLGCRVALGVEHVEGVTQVLEEVLTVVEALGAGEAHVIGVQGVGDDEMRHLLAIGGGHLHP